MDKILSKDTIKNVFGAEDPKTTDDNYSVALLDKATSDPKGRMGISDLASVLGGENNLATSMLDLSEREYQEGIDVDNFIGIAHLGNMYDSMIKYGILFSFGSLIGDAIQLVFKADGKIRWRYHTSIAGWSAWAALH